MIDGLKTWFPGAAALGRYERGQVPQELAAGLTTAVMLIPQAMAYAMLAGLPPVMGLYAALAPILIYAVLGSSRQLAVGPTALASLVVADGLSHLASAESEQYVLLAGVTAVMTGVFLAALGVFRLGFVADFVANPVVTGFTAGAALLIAGSQLPALLRIEVDRAATLQGIWMEIGPALSRAHLLTLSLGLGAIAMLWVLGRWAPKVPRALVVMTLAGLATFGLGLTEHGVAIIGDVAGGLPPLVLPFTDPTTAVALVPTALLCALVGFVESYAVADAIARRRGYAIDADRELFALGSANIASGLFGGYPTAGALSRTAVNDRAGARGPLAALITAATLLAALLFLSPILYYLPRVALAAIVIVAAIGLIDIQRVRYLLAVERRDLGVLFATFAATVLVGVELGFLIGVLASLLLFVAAAARPQIIELGRVSETESYVDLQRHAEAVQIEDVLVLRVEGRFFFANAQRVTDRILELALERRCPRVVLDAAAIGSLDTTALTALRALVEQLEDQDIELIIVHAPEAVVRVIEEDGLAEDLSIFAVLHSAVEHARSTAS